MLVAYPLVLLLALAGIVLTPPSGGRAHLLLPILVLFVCALDESAKIDDGAVVVWRLHVCTEDIASELCGRGIAKDDRDAKRLRASFQHLEYLRIRAFSHPERISGGGSLAPLHAM